jgi:hypothetical protein
MTCGLSACVLPAYTTLQPASRMTVRDERGAPLKGATVTLIATTTPYGLEAHRETKTTDANGQAAFDQRNEWRTEAPFLLHGVQSFSWSWCISKAGYATHRTWREGSSEFDPAPVVRLSPGPSSECPKPEAW